MGNTVYHAYTTTYKGLSRRLINDVKLKSGNDSIACKAQWDTGASGTCISEEAAQNLGLVPIGKVNINTPSGTLICNTYLVDIMFPNNVIIKDVNVCGTKIGSQGIDVLVGMDIINCGDLAVSNYNKQTTFSFRLPSKSTVDFVKEISIENTIGKRHGQGKRKRKK